MKRPSNIVGRWGGIRVVTSMFLFACLLTSCLSGCKEDLQPAAQATAHSRSEADTSGAKSQILGRQDAMAEGARSVSKMAQMSRSELKAFLRGKQLKRRKNSPSAVRGEYFRTDGSWSMFVEEIISTRYDGDWNVSQDGERGAVLCVVRRERNSTPINAPVEECRDVRVSLDEGIVALSMPGHRNVITEYDFSNI